MTETNRLRTSVSFESKDRQTIAIMERLTATRQSSVFLQKAVRQYLKTHAGQEELRSMLGEDTANQLLGIKQPAPPDLEEQIKALKLDLEEIKRSIATTVP